MTWWPGWSSVESAGWWSHFWFWAGIICLFLLGASEIVSHKYSLRKDELVDAASRAADEQRQREADAAEARRKTEVEGLQRKLVEESKKVLDLQRTQPQSRFSQVQKNAIHTTMSSFSAQKIAISCIMGDINGKGLAEELSAIARSAGWDDGGGIGFSQVVFAKDPIGFLILVNEAEFDAKNLPPSVQALTETLYKLGFMERNMAIAAPNAEAGKISVVIGKKPN